MQDLTPGSASEPDEVVGLDRDAGERAAGGVTQGGDDGGGRDDRRRLAHAPSAGAPRFPQLAEISFEAENRLWDTAQVSEEDGRVRVYTDPRPPFGVISLTLAR